ncbi:MAG: GNAT family N-acetyltransferase [Lachnospiraceae bacterium]|nr:GNAT family N-acetyltransferase [Lachnospiraceae bacterium]
MLFVRLINSNLEKEWDFVRKMPIEENGMTNSLNGISKIEFVEKAVPAIKAHSKGEELPYWKVPETVLFLWEEQTQNIVGLFRIRHKLNEDLRAGAGMISFFIAKEFRGMGYATEGLKLALDFARDFVEEESFYLTANDDNKASIKVMLKNGGKIVKKENGKVFVTINNPGKAKIHLEKVTPENWRFRYKICDAQRHFVSEATGILARAWAYREHHSEVHIIYADDQNVGMVLYYDIEDMNAYAYSQILIDCRYQQRGYGSEATKLVLDILEKDGRYNKVVLCYVEGNEAAKKMYENLGFVQTGDSDGNEIIMTKYFR